MVESARSWSGEGGARVTLTARQEKDLEPIPVIMVREDLAALPSFPLPPGYRLRYFRRGEGPLWAEIEVSVGEFPTVEQALAHFEKEFGPFQEEMEQRCLFLEDAAGRAIGTTTAWYNPSFQGKDYGRIHWVAIRPEQQGRKLGKPLLAAALRRLADFHTRAYLTTQTTSARAIRMYLDLGFVPFITSDRCRTAWRLLASVLQHPALEAYQEP
jgi:GNAT superfamily N-acetyltransferase